MNNYISVKRWHKILRKLVALLSCDWLHLVTWPHHQLKSGYATDHAIRPVTTPSNRLANDSLIPTMQPYGTQPSHVHGSVPMTSNIYCVNTDSTVTRSHLNHTYVRTKNRGWINSCRVDESLNQGRSRRAFVSGIHSTYIQLPLGHSKQLFTMTVIKGAESGMH